MVEEIFSDNKEALEEIIKAIKEGMRSGIKETVCYYTGRQIVLKIENNDIVGIKCPNIREDNSNCNSYPNIGLCYYLQPWKTAKKRNNSSGESQETSSFEEW